jgi:hypothetical protein
MLIKIKKNKIYNSLDIFWIHFLFDVSQILSVRNGLKIPQFFVTLDTLGCFHMREAYVPYRWLLTAGACLNSNLKHETKSNILRESE